MNDISIKKAAIINFAAKYSNIVIQILINSILARILTPNDYGIVAVITVFISFFTIIADMGVGPAIIQNKNLNKQEISDIFIFTFFVALVISSGFSIFSYPLSIFYNSKVYISLGVILSIGIFFNVLNIVPNALLLKNKQFKTLAIRTTIINIIGGIITIILALNGLKYYSLVINSVIVGLLTFILNFKYSKLKVNFGFSFDSIKKIREFSSYQFGFNFINYFARNLDNLLIGKFMGQVSLGYYDKAYKLMLYPVQNLTYVITPVLHPILSDYQDNKEKIYSEYIKIVKILSLLGVFFSVFCFFASKEIIFIMFGDQWGESVSSFRILSISIWPQMITSSTGVIFQSINNTKLLMKTGLITTIVSIVAIIIGIIFESIDAVALCIVLSYYIHFIVGFYMLIKKGFLYEYLKFMNIFKNHLFICILLIVSLSIVKMTLDFNDIFISLFVKIVVAVIVYIIGVIWTKEYGILKNLIRK